MGIIPVVPWSFPMLNTLLLLTSGISITAAHLGLKVGRHGKAKVYMAYTIFAGIFFTGVQWYEYRTCCFSINDGVYGSIFYMTTGFHGIHVLIGTIFLCVCIVRHEKDHLFKNHHVGFVCAVWYWHFVDVV